MATSARRLFGFGLVLVGLACDQKPSLAPSPLPPPPRAPVVDADGGETSGGGGATGAGAANGGRQSGSAAGGGGAGQGGSAGQVVEYGACDSQSPSLRACRQEPCGQACGGRCVDPQRDPEACGRCDVTCDAQAACAAGKCTQLPSVVVPPAPFCGALSLLADDQYLYWADLTHGSISRLPLAGGEPEIVASDLHLAALHDSGGRVQSVGPVPAPAQLTLLGGRLYFIAAPDSCSLQLEQSMECTPDGCQPRGDPYTVWKGGRGQAIYSVASGQAATPLLSAELTAELSATMDSGDGAILPPLQGLALSPDGQLLYFGLGSQLYRMPIAGASALSDITELVHVGYEPENYVLALAADAKRLYSVLAHRDQITWSSVGPPPDCVPPPGWSDCDFRVPFSHPAPLPEGPCRVSDRWYYANAERLYAYDPSNANPSVQLAESGDISGLAVTSRSAFFATKGGVIATVPVPQEWPEPDAALTLPLEQPLVRAQLTPRSLTLAGGRLFWTTAECDIRAIDVPAP